MVNELSGMDPQTVAVWFCAVYAVLWMYVTNKWLWILIASTASVMFLRFALAMPMPEQAALPPVSMLIAVLHWPIVYLSFSNPR
jgi:hypothetical protein